MTLRIYFRDLDIMKKQLLGISFDSTRSSCCDQEHQTSSGTLGLIWVFPKIVVPQNGWFTMENPLKMDDLGVPLFSEAPIWLFFAKTGFFVCYGFFIPWSFRIFVYI